MQSGTTAETKSKKLLFPHDAHFLFFGWVWYISSVLTTITNPMPGIGYFLNLLDFMGLSCSSSKLHPRFVLHLLLVLFRATGSTCFPICHDYKRADGIFTQKTENLLKNLKSLTTCWGGFPCNIGFNGTVCKIRPSRGEAKFSTLDLSSVLSFALRDIVPVYLWKHVHHSVLVSTLSTWTSQDLKKASEHGSFLSR